MECEDVYYQVLFDFCPVSHFGGGFSSLTPVMLLINLNKALVSLPHFITLLDMTSFFALNSILFNLFHSDLKAINWCFSL